MSQLGLMGKLSEAKTIKRDRNTENTFIIIYKCWTIALLTLSHIWNDCIRTFINDESILSKIFRYLVIHFNHFANESSESHLIEKLEYDQHE